MPAEVRVASMRQKIEFKDCEIVNACSNSGSDWQRDLSPFMLGPCPLYDGIWSRTMENAWQYSKLYAEHADAEGNPTQKYWDWAAAGWENPKAVRYPMGKGAKPLCSLWQGKKYGYIDARKQVYAPIYRDAVLQTNGYATLKRLYEEHKGIIAIRDFDGYDEVALGMNLIDVLNNPNRKMGHAFVIKMLLLFDSSVVQSSPALHEINNDDNPTRRIPPKWMKGE